MNTEVYATHVRRATGWTMHALKLSGAKHVDDTVLHPDIYAVDGDALLEHCVRQGPLYTLNAFRERFDRIVQYHLTALGSTTTFYVFFSHPLRVHVATLSPLTRSIASAAFDWMGLSEYSCTSLIDHPDQSWPAGDTNPEIVLAILPLLLQLRWVATSVLVHRLSEARHFRRPYYITNGMAGRYTDFVYATRSIHGMDNDITCAVHIGRRIFTTLYRSVNMSRDDYVAMNERANICSSVAQLLAMAWNGRRDAANGHGPHVGYARNRHRHRVLSSLNPLFLLTALVGGEERRQACKEEQHSARGNNNNNNNHCHKPPSVDGTVAAAGRILLEIPILTNGVFSMQRYDLDAMYEVLRHRLWTGLSPTSSINGGSNGGDSGNSNSVGTWTLNNGAMPAGQNASYVLTWLCVALLASTDMTQGGDSTMLAPAHVWQCLLSFHSRCARRREWQAPDTPSSVAIVLNANEQMECTLRDAVQFNVNATAIATTRNVFGGGGGGGTTNACGRRHEMVDGVAWYDSRSDAPRIIVHQAPFLQFLSWLHQWGELRRLGRQTPGILRSSSLFQLMEPRATTWNITAACGHIVRTAWYMNAHTGLSQHGPLPREWTDAIDTDLLHSDNSISNGSDEWRIIPRVPLGWRMMTVDRLARAQLLAGLRGSYAIVCAAEDTATAAAVASHTSLSTPSSPRHSHQPHTLDKLLDTSVRDLLFQM